MLKIDKFILKDVRCFKDKQKFNIRPLTFLVGENSTGKSTALGCFQVITDYLVGRVNSINFNSDPFQMGSFENIARRSRPKNQEFELGFEFIDDRNSTSKFQLLVTLGEQTNSANPIAKKVRFIFDDGEIIFLNTNTTKNDEKSEIKIKERNSKKIFTILSDKYQYRPFFHEALRQIYHYSRYYERRHFREEEEELSSRVREEKEKPSSEKKQLIEFIRQKKLDWSTHFYFQCFSFAPIRSEPKRTYEPWDDIATSFGNDIPVRLKNLSIKNNEDWNRLYENLKNFGTESDLFTDIKVRKFGSSSSNPFQLELKIRKGAATNLMDVGYGISQILPLLVRILTQKRYILPRHILPRHIFLMQQPEVHLHPKAQAAFTSLLAALAKSKNNAFIIETHSDYMVNRARIDIMNGNIKNPEDVSLIYLEAQGKDVEVHNLCFDKQGNFKKDPPNSYRDFFLTETHRLLGWED